MTTNVCCSLTRRRLAFVGTIFIAWAVCVGVLSAETIQRRAKGTLTAVEMDRGDTLEFTLRNGETRTLTLEKTWVRMVLSNLKKQKKGRSTGRSIYRFGARVRVDGQPMTMMRSVPVQESFYEPYVINGMRIWFDGVKKIGRLFNENHGECLPEKEARFAIQDATLPITTEQALRPWYPNGENFIDVFDSYEGTDAWMGPYYGADLHGGLDINMADGTPLWAPIRFDEQFYFNSLKQGNNNNRWRGVRRWDNGQRWVLQTHHLTQLLVPQHTPIPQGKHYAVTGGELTGTHAHTHFVFGVGEKESKILLDPWILFWQIFENNKKRAGAINATIAPLSPAKTGEKVPFSAESSSPGVTGNHLDYRWAFGDGGGAVGKRPSHVYAEPGVYPVTLVVDDGVNRASATQHITVAGASLEAPALALKADEVGFKPRPVPAMDAYGRAVRAMPKTLRFRAHPKRNPEPPARYVRLANLGQGTLSSADWRIDYQQGEGWLHVTRGSESERGDGSQVLKIKVSAEGFKAEARDYRGRVYVRAPGAANSPQVFGVHMRMRTNSPDDNVLVDDQDPACFVSPGYWLTPKLHDPWRRGVGEAYRLGSHTDRFQGMVRYQPHLAAGRYRVAFAEATPFLPTKRLDKAIQFRVRVRHRGGSRVVKIDPLESREIGTFNFSHGRRGYVQIEAEESEGILVADALRFHRLGPVKRGDP